MERDEREKRKQELVENMSERGKAVKEMERHVFLPSERQHGIISQALKLEQREQM